ncbi:MAG: COX15/CtaA family protein [Pseudomonadota bacterium]|nr:COX15/CtaA family protein [Pseudomonadota bacterium]
MWAERTSFAAGAIANGSESPNARLLWFRRLSLLGAVLAAVAVVLGAWVRLTNAGLGCPDWPGCYGHLYPSGAQTGKAWHEMVHRYVAGTLVVAIALLLAWAVLRRRDRGQPLVPVALLFGVVCFQAALGALTVTLLLKPLIVTAHLFGGLTTLGLLGWLAIAPERRALPAAERRLRKFVTAAFVVLVLQIFLGGWTSSNYAAIACPDFPTCQRSWWPPMDFRNAFVLWRGIGVDYEGGVLANPARMAIHVTHRLGAAVTGLALISVGLLAARAQSRRLRRAGLLLIVAVVLQISIGIATVRFGIPLPAATLHNAGAAALTLAMVWLMRALWPEPPAPVVPFDHGDRTR